MNSERFYQLEIVSRRIQILFFILFPLNALLGTIFKITWIFYIAPVILCVSWLVPGVLLVLRLPSLGQAWLRGIIGRTPATPWKELTTEQKFSVYINSTLGFIAAAGGLIMIIANLNVR